MSGGPVRGAGDLDQRVAIVELVETQGDGGTVSVAEQTAATVWAKVEPVRGQERLLADRERGVQTYRITGRNSGAWAALATDDKLSWRGVKLAVKTAPVAGRAAYRTIEAEAGIAT